jgi:hypothetical protein
LLGGRGRMDLRAKCRSTVLCVVRCTEDISGLQFVHGVLDSSKLGRMVSPNIRGSRMKQKRATLMVAARLI